MLSKKSFVVFVGFHPNVRILSALQRELPPSQGPYVARVSRVRGQHEVRQSPQSTSELHQQ
jgi:hypothetical protein